MRRIRLHSRPVTITKVLQGACLGFFCLALSAMSVAQTTAQAEDQAVVARHARAKRMRVELNEFSKKLMAAQSAFLAGHYLQAEAICLAARDMHPDLRDSEYSSVGHLLGEVYLAEGNYRGAIAQYDFCRDGKYLPDYPAASTAFCYLKLGNLEMARATLVQISRADPGRVGAFTGDENAPDVVDGGEAEIEASCDIIRAMAAECSGKKGYQRRMDLLKAADTLLPHNRGITYLIGEATLYLGDYAKARAILQPIGELDDKFLSPRAKHYCQLCTEVLKEQAAKRSATK